MPKVKIDHKKLDRALKDLNLSLATYEETFVEENDSSARGEAYLDANDKNDRVSEIEGCRYAIEVLTAFKSGKIK